MEDSREDDDSPDEGHPEQIQSHQQRDSNLLLLEPTNGGNGGLNDYP